MTILVPNCMPENKPDDQDLQVHIGDLVRKRNLTYAYVKGDLVDCKNVSVKYLEGNIRGRKSRVFVEVMKGNVQSGTAKIGILDGDILQGEGTTVNILIGEDFSRRAVVNKTVPNSSDSGF